MKEISKEDGRDDAGFQQSQADIDAASMRLRKVAAEQVLAEAEATAEGKMPRPLTEEERVKEFRALGGARIVMQTGIGEYVTGALKPAKPRAKLDREFLAMFTGGRDEERNATDGIPFTELIDMLPHRTLRVFARVLRFVEFGTNFAPIPTGAIAEETGIKPSNVSAAVKELEKKGILEKGSIKDGRHATYRLNPYYGWKGVAEDYQEANRAGLVRPYGSFPDAVEAMKERKREAEAFRKKLAEKREARKGATAQDDGD